MTAIGIDLGTTNSAAAVDDGKVRILPTRVSEPVTPSVVSFRPARRGQPARFLIGRDAVRNAVLAPEQTVFSIKRLMGRSVDDPRVAAVGDRYPYVISRADDPEDRGVRVVLNGVKYTPVDVSAMILRQVVEDAERVLGTKVTHAVITVPAKCPEAQRAATREAGLQAGLVVKKIIDEPTAAAIAFGMDRGEERHRVLVFDFGGGTFDLSIIQMVEQQFQVMAIGGEVWLGGDDLDREIVELIIQQIRSEHHVDPSQDRRFLVLAKRFAEEAKVALSGQPECDVNIPGAFRTPEGQTIDVFMPITREEFERRIQKYVDRGMDLVRKLLDEQHLTPEDITAVLMVGGSTAVPLVYQAVADLFGEGKVKREIDPMQCVALGAATLAARLTGVECPNCGEVNPENASACQRCQGTLSAARSVGSVGLGEVTANSLGIAAVGRDGQPDTFAVIIPKGTPYPLTRPMERLFYTTSENRIRVPVYEGQDSVASRNEFQGNVEYKLPEDVKPGSSVTVRFNYDKDRVLTVQLRVYGREDLTYETTLERDRPRASFSIEDEKWREDLEAAAGTAEYFLARYSDYLDAGTVQKTESDIRKARQMYAEGNRIAGQRVTEALRMTILGTGVASQLFLAERAADGATQEEADKLNRAMRALKDAYQQRDRRQMDRISLALQLAVVQIFRQRAAEQGLGDRDYEGLLREAMY